MDQDQRFDIEDLMPEDMVIWEDDEDLPDRQEYIWPYWRQVLDHPNLGHGYCTSCGGGGPCILLTFKDALVSSVIRELDRLGLLKIPMTTQHPHMCVGPSCFECGEPQELRYMREAIREALGGHVGNKAPGLAQAASRAIRDDVKRLILDRQKAEEDRDAAVQLMDEECSE